MNHQNSRSASYAAAGVDVTAGYESVRRIKPMVESTYIPGVLGTLGGFGGMFAPDLSGMKKPVLVSGGGTNLQALMDSDIPGGRITAQKSVAVLPDDTPETLQKRVMEQAEWILLPRAVGLYCQNRLEVRGRTVIIKE